MSWVALYPQRAGMWGRMLALAQQFLLRTVLTTEVKKGCRPPALREWHMDSSEQVAESWLRSCFGNEHVLVCVCQTPPLGL